eukprot:jgi/Chrzof1/11450/Cz05g37030.t1
MKDILGNQATSDVSWLMLCYTEQHNDSIAVAPIFAQLAKQYASDKLKFGYLDACLWPRAAKDMKITTNPWSAALPSVILYEKGKEHSRIPAYSAADDFTARNTFAKKDLVKGFDLPARSAKGAAVANGGDAASNGKRAKGNDLRKGR